MSFHFQSYFNFLVFECSLPIIHEFIIIIIIIIIEITNHLIIHKVDIQRACEILQIMKTIHGLTVIYNMVHILPSSLNISEDPVL